MAVVPFSITLATLAGPLCGEHLCGTFVVADTSSGPIATVLPTTLAVSRGLTVPVVGQANLQASMVRSVLAMSVAVAGQANVQPLLGLTLKVSVPIAGQATVSARLTIVFLFPSVCGDVDLAPAVCDTDLVLVGAGTSSLTLTPVECG